MLHLAMAHKQVVTAHAVQRPVVTTVCMPPGYPSPCPLPNPNPPPVQVFRPTGWTLGTLAAVNAFMLLVCLGAVVGSVQSLINQWSTFQFFA